MNNQKPACLYVNDGEFIQFAHEGNQYNCLVLRDDSPYNPVEEDGNLGKMLCWHPRYSWGDPNPYETATDCFYDLAAQYVSMPQVRQQITKGKTNLQLRYREDQVSLVEVWEDKEYEVVLSAPTEDEIFAKENKEEIVNAIETGLFSLVVECPEIVLLPLYLLDHSGLSISTSDFCDPWDSAQVGWIYTDKKTAEEQLGTATANQMDWKKKAITILKQEVERHNQYLSGDVYGYVLYKRNPDTNEWEETDNSCWDFYSSDIVESGLADSVPGLNEAIQSGEYSTGTARRSQWFTIF